MSFHPRPSVIPSSAKATTANGSPIAIADLGGTLGVFLDVTAVSGTTPALAVTVEWSHDGSTFFAGDPVDTFASITAVTRVCKNFSIKAPFYRLVWTISGTSPNFTFAAHEYITT